MFTKQELIAILQFLDRVEIKGAEAEGLVMLKKKTAMLLQPQKEEPKDKKDEKKEDKKAQNNGQKE